MPAQLTKEDYVERCRKVHGEKYDYPGDYTGIMDKIEIYCRTCNKIFIQCAHNHLHGKQNCRHCKYKKHAKIFALDQNDYIARASKIHPTIDYSRVAYINEHTKIELGCKECSTWFRVGAGAHLYGKSGCPGCARKRVGTKNRTPINIVIDAAKAVHGDLYDYSLFTEYKNNRDKVSIKCLKCNEIFSQVIGNHIIGKQGCPNCCYERVADKRRQSNDDIIQRGHEVHDGIYDYSQIEFVDMFTKMKIGCPRGHWFFQTPNLHLNQECGCPICADSNRISKKERAWLDSLKVEESCRQIRIPKTRFTADALVDNIIYEFNGGYYHGDPRVFPAYVFNKKLKEMMGTLYDKTLIREEKLRNLGYQVIVIWELDYDKGKMVTNGHPHELLAHNE